MNKCLQQMFNLMSAIGRCYIKTVLPFRPFGTGSRYQSKSHWVRKNSLPRAVSLHGSCILSLVFMFSC